MNLQPGTVVEVHQPLSTGVLRMSTTRLGFKVYRATVLGPVNYEPSMIRVRPEGSTGYVRTLREYLRAAA